MRAMPAADPTPSVEHEVGRIRALLRERQYAAVLSATEALLRAVPENRDLLYLRARAQRLSGATAAALSTLTELERLHPRFSRLYEERGLCQVVLRQAPDAIAALLEAVQINPALPASWSMLEGLYRMTGQTANAAAAAAQLATLKQLPAEVLTATGLYSDGELGAAEELIRAFLVKHGHHVEAMRLLARIGIERGVLDDAQLLLEGVLELSPDYQAARADYVRVLNERHLYKEAEEQAQKLLATDRGNRDFRILHALTCVGLGQHERAVGEYRGLLEGAAQPADLHLSIAHSLKTLGRSTEAVAEYRAASRYRPEVHEQNTRQQIAVCTPELFARHAGAGAAAADPIFIVGLPRSGSTLIEQILASHSQVEGTHELADVPRIVAGLGGRGADSDDSRYPAVLGRMSDADFRRLGEKYLADTRVYRTGKPRFIDKMPNNFRHVGLIHLMLPNAAIIDARREPMACCFGNFKQLFAKGQEFAYGTEEIARYYRTYLELMRHWDRVLPGCVLRVQYEDLVDDLEGNVRRILGHCGLSYERACVEFYKTERSVRTASSEQVRQPIYREGLDQWRRYEPWLGSLRAALGDALTRYRE